MDRLSARSTQALVLATGVIAATLVLTPYAPAMDLPQHLAMAAELRRLWDGDPVTSADLTVNVATHNAGFHLFVAALAKVIPIELASRLFLALCPTLLVIAIDRCLNELRLPRWRALLVIPIALGFTFCWGFVNFWMGTSLVWLAMALVFAQLRELKLWRACALGVLGLALSINHVLAMLGLAVVAAAAGLEHMAREFPTRRTGRERAWLMATVVLTGAPLLLGCIWDLHVMSAHNEVAADSYTREPTVWFSPSPLYKLALLGTLCGGLFRTFIDIGLAWVVIAMLLLAFVLYRSEKKSTLETPQSNEAPRPYVLPLVATTLAYLAIPSIFASTHQVYQRFAQWLILAALIAFPSTSKIDRRLAPHAIWMALLSAFATAAHFAAYTIEIRGLDETLANIPDGAHVTGLIEEPRSNAIRQAALVHAAAFHRVKKHGTDPFMFARYMGPPVVFLPGHEPPYPDPSWEWDPSYYRPDSAVTAQYPWVLVRTSWEEEPTEMMRARLFGPTLSSHTKAVYRSGRWALFERMPMASPSEQQ